MTKGEKITAIILAGGKNSRMGTDKGLLKVAGKSIIERQINILQPLVNDILIIHNGDNYADLGFQVHKDIIQDCGPMGGIYTALTVSHTFKNLILSCDMPFISTELLQLILDKAEDCDIAIPRHGEKLEPICAVYDRSCLSTLKNLLDQGALKMMEALKFFRVKEIPVPNIILSSNPFININTPEDFLKIKALKG
jgi:molybdenum cofactor guanylyltransferase